MHLLVVGYHIDSLQYMLNVFLLHDYNDYFIKYIFQTYLKLQDI